MVIYRAEMSDIQILHCKVCCVKESMCM